MEPSEEKNFLEGFLINNPLAELDFLSYVINL